LKRRLAKLMNGHNASYWVSKIKANVQRDRRADRLLKREGWTPLRFWESDLRVNPDLAAKVIVGVIGRARSSGSKVRR
jgi:DNA mismatch endonuclease (patch repair protein)